MSRIRIVCKAPAPTPSAGGIFPSISPLPSWENTRVTFVADDGTETDVPNVSSVSFSVSEGKIATATMTFVDVEINAEAEVAP